VTRAPVFLAVALALLLIDPLSAPQAADRPSVVWHPAKLRPGDVAWVLVRGVADGATIEGSLGTRSLLFFPYAGGQAAVVGIDLETKPGPHAWELAILEPGREPRRLSGKLTLAHRDFVVQRLTLPNNMVDLDPETERRAVSEGEQLRTLYRTITPERLWRGRWTRPVAGQEPGTGFGSRRVINGQPRAPHTGIDFAAPRGTPVVAANSGRVALLGDFFFPGRLVALDHGLGLYTLYFHLDTVAVTDGERVERGQVIGTVGSTGRSTGPHLHFGAQAGPARVDPAGLLGLDVND
jgi:murein DD-endopeptidase MepM/ murein hydrolase activator NlpD